VPEAVEELDEACERLLGALLPPDRRRIAGGDGSVAAARARLAEARATLPDLVLRRLGPAELDRVAKALGLPGSRSHDVLRRRVLGALAGWRSFATARQTARRLRVRTVPTWRAFCRGERPDLGPLPLDVPPDPDRAYRGAGWAGWRDWLGPRPAEVGAPERTQGFRPWARARAFARSLGLSGQLEWRAFCRGELVDEVGVRPADVPASPARVFADEWTTWRDWLGTERLAFEDARRLARTLELADRAAWRVWWRRSAPRPGGRALVPYDPDAVYAAWAGWGDFLGSRTGPRPFAAARAFARELGLRGLRDWRAWCRGERPDLPARPDDVPAAPDRTYRGAGWAGWGDFLGAPRRELRPFTAAREFARGLGLGGLRGWLAWCRGERPDLPSRPDDVPANPASVYRDSGWRGWRDFLGGDPARDRMRAFRSYAACRRLARAFRIRSEHEWRAWCRGDRPDLPPLPADVPRKPDHVYRDAGWPGWGAFLGTGRVATRRRTYRPFAEARRFARGLGLAGAREWKAWCRGERPDLPARPPDIPAGPDRVYRDRGWRGYRDWLGSG